MYGRMKIGVKLFLSFGLMILLLFLVGSVGYLGLNFVQNEVKSLEGDNGVSEHVNTAIQNVLESQREMSLYLLNADEKSYLAAKEKNQAAKTAFEAAKKAMGKEDSEAVKAADAATPLLDATVAGAEAIHGHFAGRKLGADARKNTGAEVNAACAALQKYINDQATEIAKTTDAEKIAAAKQHQNDIFTAIAYRQMVRLELRNIEIGKMPKERADADAARLVQHGKMVAAFTTIRDKALDDTEKKLAQAAIDKAAEWAKAAEPFKAESDNIDNAQESWKTTAVDCVAKSLAIADITKAQMQKTQLGIYDTVKSVSRWIIGAFVLAVAIGVLLIVLLTRSISHKITDVTSMLGRVVDEGDFHVNVDPKLLSRGDEIGRLAQTTEHLLGDYRGVSDLAQALAGGDWTKSVSSKSEKDLMNINLQNMVDKVNEALGKVSSVVERVAGGANEVASASEKLSNGATTSAASLEEISASMGEVGSQTNRNAQNAAEANKLAKEATSAASEGEEMMQKMIASMELITKNASDVQRVIKVIDDISFQTNLLALNAAVEAARAGTHGKGFAVVAEEVRNLAARCAKAAGETSQMVENNNKQISQGAEIAMETSGKLDIIAEQTEKTAGLINGIATASNEQAQGIQQITHGLQQIDTVTQQNSSSAEQTASVSNEMSGSATTLQGLISQFKLRQVKSGSQPAATSPSVPVTKTISGGNGSLGGHSKPSVPAKVDHSELKIDLSAPSKPAPTAVKPIVAAKPVVGSPKPIAAAKPVVAAKPALTTPKPAAPAKPTTTFQAGVGKIPKPRVEQNPNQFPDEPASDIKGGWGGVPHDQEISINLDDKSFLDDKNFGKY